MSGDNEISYRYRCGCVEWFYVAQNRSTPMSLPDGEPRELLSEYNCSAHWFDPEPCPDEAAHMEGRCNPVTLAEVHL